ncbi:MAG: type II toxin-antitoxin system VapC family toxin [Xanthomonadales bacterium]
MNRFVLDCSVTIAWFFEDEFSDYSEIVRQQLLKKGTVAVTPGIWPAEVANVLFQAERRKRITAEKTNQALRVLAQLPVDTDYLPLGSMGHVLRLCRTYRLTSYDALYLELALRENMPLATEDKKLKVSAVAAGVELFA